MKLTCRLFGHYWVRMPIISLGYDDVYCRRCGVRP